MTEQALLRRIGRVAHAIQKESYQISGNLAQEDRLVAYADELIAALAILHLNMRQVAQIDRAVTALMERMDDSLVIRKRKRR